MEQGLIILLSTLIIILLTLITYLIHFFINKNSLSIFIFLESRNLFVIFLSTIFLNPFFK